MADKGAAAAGTGGVIQKYSDVMIAAACLLYTSDAADEL